MKKVFKAHPLIIFTFMKPFLFVLVFPFIKALIQYFLDKHITDVLSIELTIFVILSAIAFLRYRAYTICRDEENVTVKTGFIFRRTAVIKISNLSSVQITQNPIEAIFSAVTVCINTEAGTTNHSDFKLKMWKKDYSELVSKLYSGEVISKVRFSALRVAIMAAATSSAFSGIIIGVPLINRAGKLLGIGLSEMLLEELNHVSSKIETYFPPAVNTATLILLLCYAVSFAYSFFKYINFKLLLNDEKLEVHTGFFVKIKTAFKKSSVNDVMIVQTPLMLLLRRYAMKVSVGGFGEAKSESQIVVPAGTYKEIKGDFAEYFPFLVPSGNSLRAKRHILIKGRFLFWPSIYLLLVLGASITSCFLFNEFTRFIFFITLILLCVVFYYAYICLFEYEYGKLKFSDSVMAKSTKGFRTCRLYCPKEKIGEIKITRFFTDFYYKTCRVRITVRSEGADTMRVRHLNYYEVMKEIYRNFDL